MGTGGGGLWQRDKQLEREGGGGDAKKKKSEDERLVV